jgi:hypothetical protein
MWLKNGLIFWVKHWCYFRDSVQNLW